MKREMYPKDVIFLNNVTNTIKKYNLINDGDKLVLGVSGGPDSICMLDVLNRIKNDNSVNIKFDMVVAHVNHMIRAEAGEDEKFVKDCDILITHGGVGSIFDGLINNKKIIAFPRMSEYREAVNDHQKQIVDKFYNEGYILTGKIDELDKFVSFYLLYILFAMLYNLLKWLNTKVFTY